MPPWRGVRWKCRPRGRADDAAGGALERIVTERSRVAAEFDLIERIRAAVYKLPDKRIDYGGASALEKFDKEVQSLGGADDFLFECEKGQAA